MVKQKKVSEFPDVVDVHVGQRIKLRRVMMGLSQDDMAKACGVSFQQIQKYEVAGNRISASRLFQIGNILSTPVAFFFEGLPNQTVVKNQTLIEQQKKSSKFRIAEPNIDDPLLKNDSLKLINMFWNLPDDKLRENVMDLIKSLSKTSIKKKTKNKDEK